MKRLLVALSLVSVHCLAWCELPLALQTNGCGAKHGWSAILVPNSTVITGCKFESSCNQHDICYGKCLPGGTLFGQLTCDDPVAKAARRETCDLNLRENIAQENADKRVCGMYASLYHWAVVKYGESAFHGIMSVNANMMALNAFLDYVALHPDAFDQNQVRAAFENLNSKDALDTPIVKFQAYPPQLSIETYDPKKESWVTAMRVQGRAPEVQ